MRDERRKLAMVKRLQAQGLSETEIEKQLNAFDEADEVQALEEFVGKSTEDLSIQLGSGAPAILGPNGKPIKSDDY